MQKNIYIFGILQDVVPKICKYVGSIIDDSVITWDKIIEETKTVTTKTVGTNNASTKFCILLVFFINYHNIIDSC